MMSYNKLYFDRDILRKTGNKIEFSPNFICPVCREYDINGKITEESPRHQSIQTSPVSHNNELDINGLIMFIMPCCETQISLYIAVHKMAKQDGLMKAISADPIPDGWWVVVES